MSNFIEDIARIHRDVFLAHACQKDKLGRDTHKRVVGLAEALSTAGIHAWVDEKDLAGPINSGMFSGIYNSKYFAMCVTEEYLNKIGKDEKSREEDCCFVEFRYACKMEKTMILIFLDHSNVDMWPSHLAEEGLYAPTKGMNGDLFVEFRMDDMLDSCVASIRKIIGYEGQKAVLQGYMCEECSTYCEKLVTCCESDIRICHECAIPCAYRECEKYFSKTFIEHASDIETDHPFKCTQCIDNSCIYAMPIYCSDHLHENECCFCKEKYRLLCTLHLELQDEVNSCPCGRITLCKKCEVPAFGEGTIELCAFRDNFLCDNTNCRCVHSDSDDEESEEDSEEEESEEDSEEEDEENEDEVDEED